MKGREGKGEGQVLVHEYLDRLMTRESDKEAEEGAPVWESGIH